MPRYGTESLAKRLDQFYTAIFESGQKDPSRRLTPATIFSEIAGDSTDVVYTLPVFRHRVYGALRQYGSGVTFGESGYLPGAGHVRTSDAFLDYAGTTVVIRLNPVTSGTRQVFAACPSDISWEMSRNAGANGGWSITMKGGGVNRTATAPNAGLTGTSRTFAAHLGRDQIGISMDGASWSFDESGSDLAANVPTHIRDLYIGRNASAGQPSVSPIRWIIIVQGGPLPQLALSRLHELPDEFIAGAMDPERFAAVRLLAPIINAFEEREEVSFLWTARSPQHVPLSVVGVGYLSEGDGRLGRPAPPPPAPVSLTLLPTDPEIGETITATSPALPGHTIEYGISKDGGAYAASRTAIVAGSSTYRARARYVRNSDRVVSAYVYSDTIIAPPAPPISQSIDLLRVRYSAPNSTRRGWRWQSARPQIDAGFVDADRYLDELSLRGPPDRRRRLEISLDDAVSGPSSSNEDFNNAFELRGTVTITLSTGETGTFAMAGKDRSERYAFDVADSEQAAFDALWNAMSASGGTESGTLTLRLQP